MRFEVQYWINYKNKLNIWISNLPSSSSSSGTGIAHSCVTKAIKQSRIKAFEAILWGVILCEAFLGNEVFYLYLPIYRQMKKQIWIFQQ